MGSLYRKALKKKSLGDLLIPNNVIATDAIIYGNVTVGPISLFQNGTILCNAIQCNNFIGDDLKFKGNLTDISGGPLDLIDFYTTSTNKVKCKGFQTTDNIDRILENGDANFNTTEVRQIYTNKDGIHIKQNDTITPYRHVLRTDEEDGIISYADKVTGYDIDASHNIFASGTISCNQTISTPSNINAGGSIKGFDIRSHNDVLRISGTGDGLFENIYYSSLNQGTNKTIDESGSGTFNNMTINGDLLFKLNTSNNNAPIKTNAKFQYRNGNEVAAFPGNSTYTQTLYYNTCNNFPIILVQNTTNHPNISVWITSVGIGTATVNFFNNSNIAIPQGESRGYIFLIIG